MSDEWNKQVRENHRYANQKLGEIVECYATIADQTWTPEVLASLAQHAPSMRGMVKRLGVVAEKLEAMIERVEAADAAFD